MDLDQFLDSASERKRRCLVCELPELAADVATFVAARKAGTTNVALLRLHRDYLVPKYGLPKASETVRKHVRTCLEEPGI